MAQTKSIDLSVAPMNETWLHGKYKRGSIDTALPSIEVTEEDFFVQGDEAEKIIKDIFFYWCFVESTTEEAFEHWINSNF